MEVVSLGKLLIKELDLKSSTDTLSRWMAHHLAGLIKQSEDAKGSKKKALEKECFDLILKLWEHRSNYPVSKPLESFKPILILLDYLQGDKTKQNWYFRLKDIDADEETREWINLASGIDYSARLLIRWCIAGASTTASQKERKWLEAGIPMILSDADDLKAIKLLIDDSKFIFGTDDETLEKRNKELHDIRDRLDSFIKLTNEMKNSIDEQLPSKS